MDRGKSRSLLLVLGLATFLAVPTPSFAQLYVGPYVGAAIPHDADVTVTDRFLTETTNEANAILAASGLPLLTSLSIDISDIEFDAGVMVGGRVGYWLEALDLPFLGVEAEVYGAFPEISNQDIVVTATAVSGGVPVSVALAGPITKEDFDVVTVGFNLLARYPFGPIQPYGGVGVAIVHAELVDDDDTAAGLQLIGGVRGFVTDNVALFGEYKFVTTSFEFDFVELDYSASHVYGGLEFYFGSGIQQP